MTKDMEFDKILNEMNFDGVDKPVNFEAIKSIVDSIKKLNINEKNFENNRLVLRKCLQTLSEHVFPMYLNKINPGIRLPGSHDFNVCLLDQYFNYDVYESFYKEFIECVKVIVDSKGEIYPRYFCELIKRYKEGNVIFVKATNIYVDRSILPSDEKFDNCVLNKYYRKYDDLKIGTLKQYESFYKKSFGKEKGTELFTKFKMTEYPVMKEVRKKNKYDNLENMKVK